MSQAIDIAICGAGLVGMSLAIALAKNTSLTILLFDAKASSAITTPTHLDTRTLALNAFSQQLLEDLDLWFELAPYAEAIHSIQISERGSFAKATLKASTVNSTALGYVIEIADLQRVLTQKIAQFADRIRFMPGTSLEDFSCQTHGAQLELQQNGVQQSLNCRWLIAADSSQSFIRQRLNIPVRQHDYQQTAIVSVVQLEQEAQGRAFERFLSDGVLALLPLSRKRCGAVWVMPQSQAAAALELNDTAYRDALQDRFGRQLGAFSAVGPRQHYPLQLLLAEKVIIDQTMIIGNAAHTLNPIGAQGLNLGLHDVACLSAFFKDGLDTNALSEKLLCRNRQLAQFADRSARFFALDFCPVKVTRRLGLLALEHSGLLKHHFIRRMMGY